MCVDIIDRYYVGAANLKLLDYLNMIIGSSGSLNVLLPLLSSSLLSDFVSLLCYHCNMHGAETEYYVGE